MRWIKAALAGVLLLAAGISADDKRLAVYSPLTSFTLPVTAREGRDYVGLLEILEPIGNVGAVAEGKKWKLRFNTRSSELSDGNTRAKINGKDFDLPAPFHMESGRGYVPLSSLGSLIPQVTGTREVVFHEQARRIFIGKVSVRYTAVLERSPSPRLVLNFTSPVNPTIGTEPGKVHLTFRREPVMAVQQTRQVFDDKNITAAEFEEANGSAEITVSTAIPLLASFSNEGRTITLAPAPQAAAQQAAPAPTNAPAPVNPQPQGNTVTSGTVGPSSASTPTPSSIRHFFAIIDASHGGTERGAALGDSLAEKDITLAIARYLQKELQNAGLSTLMLRDSDTMLSLDQRAAFANSAHPALYIAIHAGSQGRGVRVYSSLLPWGGEARGPFQPWEAAQAPFVSTAQAVTSSIAAEVRKQKIPAASFSAPLQPLNHILAPAIAVEVAPQDSDLNSLNAADYQQTVVRAVVAGIAAQRSRLEAGR